MFVYFVIMCLKFVLSFVLVCQHVYASNIGDEMTEIIQRCCNDGSGFARSHAEGDCSSSQPLPAGVPGGFGSLCTIAQAQCCKEYFLKKKDCDVGIDISSSNNRCNSNSDYSKVCCKECTRGTSVGRSQGVSGCVASRRSTSAEDLLSGDAFEKCCMKAANKNRGASHANANVVSVSKKSEVLPSLCEDYAPNELCAHHCIPVPGSYKCECNPGFQLMADGRNCKEVVKNRCKPRNPCQHKCNDNGVDVLCSCRRGYELMPDGKSCQDIDECQLDIPVCLPGTQCFNIQGSYKCIPQKKKNMPGLCPPGFARNIKNNACDDINECKLVNPPCPAYICENTMGGYKCDGVSGDPVNLGSSPRTPPVEDRCPPGFTLGLHGECDDVDECEIGKDDCNHMSQFCINTHSSFYCQDKASKHCPPGFKINSGTGRCEDIDECEDDSEMCRPDQICINQLGAYDCKQKPDQKRLREQCPDGMRRNPQTLICDDIDECVEGTHLCDQHQSCLNTNGSFECHCKLGYELDITTGACVDVNECATSQHDCIIGSQRCDNTVGSFLCIRITSCGTGYILQHSTGKCEDVDECALGTHNCARAGPEYQCMNIPGSFRCVKKRVSTTTTLSPDYEYVYYDSEEEEGNQTSEVKPEPPKPSPTPEPVTTTEEPKPTTPKEIRPEENDIAPPTIEERIKDAQENLPNRENSESSPPPESKYEKPRPTEPPPQPEPAEPKPEIVYKESNPDNNWDSNTPERRYPDSTYYETRSEIPERRNEVTEAYERPVETKPTESYPEVKPTMTSYPEVKPTMRSYPEEIPTERIPEPEPEDKRVPTYSPYGTTKPEPTPPRAIYVQVGPETATVAGEKKADGSVVVDTKEVPKNTWTKIDVKPSDCPLGFEVNDYGGCFDIDECATNRHSCSGFTEICRNTIGGYLCDCAAGFRRDLITGACDLVISSTSSTTSAPPPPPPPPTTTPEPISSTSPRQMQSIDTGRNYFYGYRDDRLATTRPFRPRSRCDAGFHHNFQTGRCEDINECTNGQATCADVEICVNTLGGYRCECPPNWTLDEGRHRCIPNRNKGAFPSGYGNVPVQVPEKPNETVGHGSHGTDSVDPEITQVEDGATVHKCPWGYRLGDDHTCIDVDECVTGEAKCGSIQICTNLAGGYSCSCPRGHRLVGDHECEDVDECAIGGNSTCSEHADCINTVGSYICKCRSGFRPAPNNDKVCMDVNECAESRPGSLCQHRCSNVWGSYTCFCHRGYRLNSDNRTCSDVDECVQFKSKIPCVGKCLNEPGSYRCACPPGYRISEDKRSCIDIDECETGEATCQTGMYSGTSHVCFNTRGSYRCHRITCPPGYQLESKHRCSKTERVCRPGDWECAHQPTTISYNFITFVSKLYIPESNVKLFTMRGPAWSYAKMKFELRLVDVNAPPSVKDRADINAFLLIQNNNEAVMSLVRPLEGPQSIELELSMELYSREQFGGIAVAKLFIHVSEYEF